MRRLDLENKYQAMAKENLNLVLKRLREERLSQNLTQKDVADKAGISLSSVSKFENGRYPTRLVWFVAMLNALGYAIVVTAIEDE